MICTVAILAQGTHWAVAVTQAFFWASGCRKRSAAPGSTYVQRPGGCISPWLSGSASTSSGLGWCKAQVVL